MKSKLTLSIDRRKVAMLRKASARKGSSISELVEQMAQQLDEQRADDQKPAISQYLGTLVLPDEAFEEDSRGGAELRKTEAYQIMKKKAKRKRA